MCSRPQDCTVYGAPLVPLMMDVLVTGQIGHQRCRDLLIAVAAIGLERGGECEANLTPAPVLFGWCHTGVL